MRFVSQEAHIKSRQALTDFGRACLILLKKYCFSFQTTKHGDKCLAATWSDKGKVHVWDLTRTLLATNDPEVMQQYTMKEEATMSPAHTFTGHQVEGFALDWSQTMPGNSFDG